MGRHQLAQPIQNQIAYSIAEITDLVKCGSASPLWCHCSSPPGILALVKRKCMVVSDHELWRVFLKRSVHHLLGQLSIDGLLRSACLLALLPQAWALSGSRRIASL